MKHQVFLFQFSVFGIECFIGKKWAQYFLSFVFLFLLKNILYYFILNRKKYSEKLQSKRKGFTYFNENELNIIHSFYKDGFAQFTYDDLMDECFIFNYIGVQALDPIPLDVIMDIESLNLIKVNSNIENEMQLYPEFLISLNQKRIKWQKDQSLNIKINVSAQDIIFSHFEKTAFGYLKKEIIGKIIGKDTLCKQEQDEMDKTINIPNSIIQQIIPLEDQPHPLPSFSKENSKNQKQEHHNKKFNFRQTIIRNSGDKDVTLNLFNTKILIQAEYFLKLLDCITPQPQCYPQYKQTDFIHRLVFIFKWQNTVFVLPPTRKLINECVALRGDMSVIFTRERIENQEKIKNLEKQNDTQKMNLQDKNMYAYNIQINDLEVFACKYNQILTNDFSRVTKRYLVHPITAFFKSKYELKVGPSPSFQEFFYIENEGLIQKTKIKVSVKHLQLLYDSLMQQQEMYSLYYQNNNQNQQINNIDENINNENYQAKQQFSVNIQDLEIFYINDIDNIPLLHLKLFETDFLFSYDNVKFQSDFYANIPLQFAYYNPSANYWEPIIEKSQLQIDYCSNPDLDIKKVIHIELSEQFQQFNINISDKLITLLNQIQQTYNQLTQNSLKNEELCKNNHYLTPIQQLQNIEIDIQQQQESPFEKIEYISPFSILNNTGYDIFIQNEAFSIQMIIKNEENLSYEINQDIQQQQQQYNTVNIKILKDNLPILTNVKLFHQKPILLNINKQHFLILENKVEQNRKILHLRSLISLKNSTNNSIEIEISQKTVNNILQKILQKLIQPSEIFYIPFNLLDCQFSFKFQGSLPSTQISIRKLLQAAHNKSYEIKHGEYYTYLNIQKTIIQNPNYQYEESQIIFEPLIKIKNCLPLKVEYDILIENNRQLLQKKQLFEGEINYQEQIQNHNSNLASQIHLKIRIPGFQGTDSILLTLDQNLNDNSKKQEDDNYILFLQPLICDFYGNQFEINIKSIYNPYGCRKYYIYGLCVIVNQIPFDIFYFYLENSQQQIKYSPGQKVKNIPQTQYVTETGKINLFASRNSLLLSTNENGLNLSKNINVGGIGNDCVDVYLNQNSFLEVHVDVNVIQVDKVNNLFTKIITLTPKYILFNNTGHRLKLRQENVNEEFTIINPGERTPLIWSDKINPKIIILYYLIIKMALLDGPELLIIHKGIHLFLFQEMKTIETLKSLLKQNLFNKIMHISLLFFQNLLKIKIMLLIL
ncbi:PH domain protein, partial [Ichthyophthirius multifiliis]